MFNKIKQFLIEKAKWKKAGKPFRSEAKIQELFIICSSNQCENYIKDTDTVGNCNVCGCRLTNEKELFNKLAWATTICPLDSPKWLPEPEYQNLEIPVEEILESTLPPSEETPPPLPPKRPCGCGG